MDPKPPDVIVLSAEWPERALLRAQLIEQGHEIVALDTWPIPRVYRRPGMKPRVLLIDLHEQTFDRGRRVTVGFDGCHADRDGHRCLTRSRFSG